MSGEHRSSARLSQLRSAAHHLSHHLLASTPNSDQPLPGLLVSMLLPVPLLVRLSVGRTVGKQYTLDTGLSDEKVSPASFQRQPSASIDQEQELECLSTVAACTLTVDHHPCDESSAVLALCRAFVVQVVRTLCIDLFFSPLEINPRRFERRM